MKFIISGLGLVALCLVLTAQSGAVINSDMVEAIWLFDDGSGNVVKDSSGNGRHGDIEGGVEWVDGKFGGGLELNGVDGEVVITGYKGIGGTHGRTTVLWFRSPERKDSRLVCWGANANARKYHIRVHDALGTLRVETQDGQMYSTVTEITDGEWHHLAVVLPDGADMCQDHLLYVDGKLEEEFGGTDVGVDTDITTNDVEIGYDKNIGHGQYASGTFDEVAIFNVALSAADINAIMDQGFSQTVLSVSLGDKLATTWASLKK